MNGQVQCHLQWRRVAYIWWKGVQPIYALISDIQTSK